MNFVLFLHLLLWWTCAFAYAQALVSYFSLLHSVYQDVWTIRRTLFFSFSTCYCDEQAAVSYFSPHGVYQNVSTIIWTLFFIFLTCYFCQLVCLLQLVSYTFHCFITFIILTRWVNNDKICFYLHLLLLWTCAFTAWCLAGKLLSLLPNIHHCDKMYDEWQTLKFSFSTCYFDEFVHSHMLSG